MSSTESSTHVPGLAVDVTRLVTREEEGDAGDFVRDGATTQGVQVADFGFGVTGACGIVYGRRHARFNQAGADGIAANGGAGELVAGCLHQRNDGGFGGGVIG